MLVDILIELKDDTIVHIATSSILLFDLLVIRD